MADEITSSGAAFAEAPTSSTSRHDGSDAMAAALVERGVWTPDQAAAALAEPEEAPADGGALAPAVSAVRDATELQGSLLSAGIDSTTARFVGQMFERAALNPPSPEARAQAAADCEAHLRDSWGEHFDGMLATAQAEMRELARGFPKLPELLDSTALGDHPFLIRQLAERGVRRAAARRLGIG